MKNSEDTFPRQRFGRRVFSLSWEAAAFIYLLPDWQVTANLFICSARIHRHFSASLSLHSLKYTRSFTHSPHTHTHTLHTALFLNRATLRQCAAAEWILGKHWDIYLNIQFLAVCVFSIISLHIIAAPRLNSECWHALHVVVISDFFSELNTNLECTYHFELFLIFSFNISSFTVINIVVL